MFDQILVPLDGSPIAASALSHVLAVTQQHEAAITLIRVVEPAPEDASVINPTDWQLRRTEASTYLDELVADCAESCKAEVNKVIMEGPAADRILEYAQEHGHDLIVISSHGKGGLSDWNVSSVALKVINRCGIAILLVRAYQVPEAESPGTIRDVRYRRILVPLDGSLRSEHVLPVATRLAEKHEAELLLVHGVVKPELFDQKPVNGEYGALIEKIIEHNRRQAERYFDELSQRLDVSLQTYVLTSDDVASSLHRFVAEHEVDLVVLSAHGRAGRSDWRYGSLTSGFIAYGTTHLLIIQDLPWHDIDEGGAAQAAQTNKTAAMRKKNSYAAPTQMVDAW